MKLTAIVILWDGAEFLPYLIPNLQQQADDIIVVYSIRSNFGERLAYDLPKFYKTKYINCEPSQGGAHTNETRKRNYGLRAAIHGGATHILMCDVDEFYKTEEFNTEKERIYSSGINGLVCGLKCFFGSPELTVEGDKTLVAFIQKVTPRMEFGAFKHYPFSYDQFGPRIDPTRRLNVKAGIEWSNILMYHYSWVRKDIDLKIRNSSARVNLMKSSVRQDYFNAKEGYFCRYYQKELTWHENIFNIRI
jgi:hypothetical protein